MPASASGRPVPRFTIGSSLKMYFGHRRQVEWTRRVAEIAADHPAVRDGLVQPFVIPTFPSIAAVHQQADPAGMLVGAQDVHWEDSGAYTGEVSAPELAELGVALVEIGHAERRALFGETDSTAALKVAASLRHGLVPVLCIGEQDRGTPAAAAEECLRQLEACLAAARRQETGGALVVAYEPVWAIGQPVPAPDAHIRAVTSALRAHLLDDGLVPDARVIYGGSAGPGLLTRIASDVDGMFLGRFAHDPAAFGAILDEASDIGGGSDSRTS
ncbi:triose-phosphate isomerase family protein [Arthrobacter agilis]|uniref:triose-phosphate isomerase family protein n=1 Tax=Arthrobacter agilis TaxID=37921 RepID=UPI0027D8E949|nr:triose-phosphate isomerase family protein [Arthrobacter agilis]